jgi:hypothetical protein
MLVGTLQVRMVVREARSLKDKRQVVLSIKDRLRNNFNVSVAEVDAQDDHKRIVLGVAMVSNETMHLRKSLSQVVEALRAHPVAQLVDFDMEV